MQTLVVGCDAHKHYSQLEAHETRDFIVTPLLKVIMPPRGRIDVSGRTG
jgi:hypothetical protein